MLGNKPRKVLRNEQGIEQVNEKVIEQGNAQGRAPPPHPEEAEGRMGHGRHAYLMQGG